MMLFYLWCCLSCCFFLCFFFFQAEDGIRDWSVTGVQTCALPILDGYAFTVLSPVTSVRSTSTRVDRISPVVVPPYTLAVEPKQDLQNLSKPRKPFDVLLRVHSYATEPGQTRVGVVVPKGWKASAPVALKFNGTGDRYARVVVAPPQNLEIGRAHV